MLCYWLSRYGLCSVYSKNELYSNFIGLDKQSLVNVFVKIYCKRAGSSKYIVFKSVYNHCPIQQIITVKSEDEETSVTMSDTTTSAVENNGEDLDNSRVTRFANVNIDNVNLFTPSLNLIQRMIDR